MSLPLRAITQADDEQTLLAEYVAEGNLDELIPRLARDRQAIQRIETVVRGLNTGHAFAAKGLLR